VYRVDGRLVLSPSDLTRHQECHHLTALNLEVADGRLQPPAEGVSDQTVLVADLGIAHELSYLEYLEEQGLTVARLQGSRDETATTEAMRAGVDVVHQATLFDGTWGGQADFLLKTAKPSDLGEWSYEVADAKLARRVKVPALLQMATYADRLATLQGREPERICVVTGDGETRPWRLVDVAAYARRAQPDAHPDRVFVGQPGGTGTPNFGLNGYFIPFSQFSPAGFNGRFLYGRISVEF